MADPKRNNEEAALREQIRREEAEKLRVAEAKALGNSLDRIAENTANIAAQLKRIADASEALAKSEAPRKIAESLENAVGRLEGNN